MENISIKKAALITFVSRYSNIFIQIIINSILARILTPDDYGVVAIINVFISFFAMIADMGIGPAIIQNKELDKHEISDIFNFTFFSGIIISVLFCLFSYPIARFYDNNAYITLGPILAIGILFNVLNIVPNALLMKEKKFKLVGIRTVIITILGGIVTIILASNDFKYYALAINSILVALLNFIFNFYSSKLQVHFSFNMKSLSKIRHFSSYQFGFGFINYFSRNLDNLLIGKVLGPVQLGYYDKAYKLMLYPVQNLTFVISPVLHPILSDYQNDKKYIYNTYEKVVKILSLLGVFFGVFCFFASSEIILIMFGEQWINSIGVFKILSISIWPQVVTSSSGTIFQSLGCTKQLFYTGIITTSINIMSILIGISLGSIELVAIGIVISYILSFIISYKILLRKVFRQPYIEFIKIFIPHIFISILMILGLKLFEFSIDNILLSISYKLTISLILYLVGLYCTKEIKYFKSFIKRKNN